MAGTAGEGSHEGSRGASRIVSMIPEGIDLEDLAISIGDIIDDIGAGGMSGFGRGDEEDADDDDEPDAEEEEYESCTLAEEVKRYQREFRRYIRMIRKGLEDLGYVPKGRQDSGNDGEYSKDSAREKVRDPQADINPWDRGHKWGCGCPGCTAFKEDFLSDGMTDFSIPDIRGTASGSGSKEATNYDPGHKDDRSDYPCGGKLRGMFKGGFLKYTLAGVGKKPGMMNYLAV
jgi:hypothetical protein